MFEILHHELQHSAFIKNKEESMQHLSVLLRKAIKQQHKVGIAFSGGLDSSLLALLSKDFHLYTVGFPQAQDMSWAKQLASDMHWPITIKTLDLKEAERIIKETTQILQTTDVTKVGVGCVVYAVLEMAKHDGITTVLGGLGAEEIFGGYARHMDYEKKDMSVIHERLWHGLHTLEERDLSRDTAIAKHFKIHLVAPFLNEELVRYAMQIDPSLKMSPSERKIILRETAEHLGLPHAVAWRKKVACQYGSQFDRALLKLAKRHRFKTKKEYLAFIIKK